MKVTLVLATTTTALLDTQGDFGFYRFKVPGQDDVDTQQPTAEYDLPGGTSYDVVCQAYDASGAPLASTSLSFTVPTDTTPPAPPPAPRTYEAPSGLTANFG